MEYFRARGKGKLGFRVLRKNLAKVVHTEEIDSPDWKDHKFTFRRPGEKKEDQYLVLWPSVKNGDHIDVDDLYLR